MKEFKTFGTEKEQASGICNLYQVVSKKKKSDVAGLD